MSDLYEADRKGQCIVLECMYGKAVFTLNPDPEAGEDDLRTEDSWGDLPEEHRWDILMEYMELASETFRRRELCPDRSLY